MPVQYGSVRISYTRMPKSLGNLNNHTLTVTIESEQRSYAGQMIAAMHDKSWLYAVKQIWVTSRDGGLKDPSSHVANSLRETNFSSPLLVRYDLPQGCPRPPNAATPERQWIRVREPNGGITSLCILPISSSVGEVWEKNPS